MWKNCEVQSFINTLAYTKPAATIGVVPTNIRSVSKNQQQVLAWADIFLEWWNIFDDLISGIIWMISRFRLLWMLKWCDIQKALSLPTAQKSSTFQNGKALPVTEWGGQVDNEGGWSWGGFLVQPCDHVTVMKVFTKIVTPRSPSVTCNFWEVTHGSGNDRQFFVTLAKVFATWTQKRFAHISSARWLGKCRNGSHKEALVSSQK